MYREKILIFASISIFSAASFAKGIQISCPNGIGAKEGDLPKLVQKLDHGYEVIICGYENETTMKKAKVYSEFNLYLVDPKGAMSKALKEVDSLTDFAISGSSGVLDFDEVVWSRGTWVPIFHSFLKCEKKKCSFSKEICIPRPTDGKPDTSLNELKSYIVGKNKGSSPSDSLIIDVGNLAIVGNNEAKAIFDNGRSSLNLDGAALESFIIMQRLIKRLADAKCL